MTNYREILRLHSLGLNKTEIATSCRCARNTVAATLQRATNCGLKWPLPEDMSDKQLSERLFPASASKPVYKMPDYAYVHKELQRSGVTLNLLWLEYCYQCRAAGEVSYQSTQFNKYYEEYLPKTNATMHLNHKPGSLAVELLFLCPLRLSPSNWLPGRRQRCKPISNCSRQSAIHAKYLPHFSFRSILYFFTPEILLFLELMYASTVSKGARPLRGELFDN